MDVANDRRIFVCPVCRAPLYDEGNRCTCLSNHSFDKARQGYVNLLISSKQGNHGDDKRMVSARRSFLEKGYYSALRSRIAEIVGCGNVVLDAGCGEGYYTSVLAEKNEVYGIDVSKEAVKMAAGKYKNARFAVASVYDMPVGDGSVDVLTNVFSPDASQEFLRVLKKGGRLINVTPMENHLIELKAAVYDEPYKNKYVDPERDGYKILSKSEVKYEITLDCNDDIVALFEMTPYCYNTSENDRKKLEGISDITIRLEFLITEYEKL